MATSNTAAQDFPFQLDEFYLDLGKDGNKISLLSAEDIVKRPFPGLRPYKTSEFQLFKGRGGQAEELLNRLNKRNFLAVIGSSGTGKSSLVRAGLIPQLLGGYLYSAGNQWDIAICRPGKNPVENLSIALSCVKSQSKDKDDILSAHAEIEPMLNNSIYGVLEVRELLKANHAADDNTNLLIIVDQFEELFRFDRRSLGNDNIEKHFVNLLLKATSIPHSSVFVIITMRSEFLGDCVKYRGLPEAINEAQYLVPQLSRDQLKEVITGPIQLAGRKIDTGLTELLINEIEESKLKENLDQLPIMQHALMRTYNEAMKEGADTEINYKHYTAIGGMEKALANHAEWKYEKLGDGISELSGKQRIAKVIFQAITDLSTNAKGGRRPTDLSTIYKIAEGLKATPGEVDEVINHFRDNDTSFIMPPISTALYPNVVIDISHESLMRNWDLLNTWVTEEINAGKLYRTLNERRELHDQKKDGWIRGGLLSEILDWQEKYPANATWAMRYAPRRHPAITPEMNKELYEKNLAFLATSAAENKKRAEKEKEDLKEVVRRASKEKRVMITLVVGAVVILIVLGFSFYLSYQNDKINEKNGQMKSQNDQITTQNEQIKAQNDTLKMIDERNTRKLILKDIALMHARDSLYNNRK